MHELDISSLNVFIEIEFVFTIGSELEVQLPHPAPYF